MKGLFALVRTINDLVAFDVDGERILPVLNRAPRLPRPRAELTRALSDLLTASIGSDQSLVAPIFLPERPVDQALRDGVALPTAMARTLARAYAAVRAHAVPRTAPPSDLIPEPVVPGSLGPFTPQEGFES